MCGLFFRVILLWAAGLVRWFDFSEEMVEYVAEGKRFVKAIQKQLQA